MSSQPNGTHFVTCRCLHCDGGIEFDINQLERDEIREVECPHCHLESLIFAPVLSPSIQAAAAWLKTILRRAARKMRIQVDEGAIELIASCSLRTPMDVIWLLKLVVDSTKEGQTNITKNIAARALQEFAQKELEEAKKESAKEQIQEPSSSRKRITSEVRREVWRRDGGKCAKCGSRENLEYDHIIPITKGGSNTVRNIELLCEVCNRAKSDLIQ